MVAYALRRAIGVIPVLVAISLVTFAIMRLIPGDPVEIMWGGEVDQASVQAARRRLGLDRPLPIQYVLWLSRVARGDLGRSLRTHQPVADAIARRLPVTAELTLLATGLVLLWAVPVGVIAAVRRETFVDTATSVLSLVGLSVPSFVFGIILIDVFALRLRWLPSLGYVPLTEHVVGNIVHMILPAVALATSLAAVIMRILRGSMLEVLSLDFVLVARSKGLPGNNILFKHALKNALLPVLTVAGLQIGALLGGTVLVETVFGLPGVGRLLLDGILARDYPIVQATVLLLAATRVATSVAVDLLYAGLDARIRFE
jgi:peptide/nickel transport system permease protein